METTIFWEAMLKFMVIAEEPAAFIFVAEKTWKHQVSMK
jgi:hypothetical protein